MLIQLVVIQILTFIVLLFALRFLFHKNLDIALKRLRILEKENLAREAELKDEIKKAEQERLAQVEQGKKEAKEITESAKKEAERLRMNLEQEARRDAQQIVQKGKAEIDKLKRNLSEDIENKASNLSLQMIRHTFSSEGKEVLHHQFIDEVIRQIEEIDKSKFLTKTENIQVKTSYPLDNKEKAAIKEVLSKKLGMSVKLQEEIDSELIAGLLIQIDSLIIDGSLQNRLRKVIPYLKEDKKV
ncbi:MAG: F0F1 ATP synthase subunit delta [Candidatus Omnitrophica bacterium]|nr:F0F1 ATP synthase subunit delta [Candidatus Omnitrophota bacterium]